MLVVIYGCYQFRYKIYQIITVTFFYFAKKTRLYFREHLA
jgi:hypothetical protein